MKEYTFAQIKECFDDNTWRLGYLTKDQTNLVYNIPVRREYLNVFQNNCFIPIEDNLVIIFVQHTVDFDYGQIEKITQILNTNLKDLEIFPQELLNLKMAMVLSGLGQYGKNSLIYDDIFGFDIHIAAMAIKNPIRDLPKQQPARFGFLPQCKDCVDCFNACPVKAIHNQQEGPVWIDAAACDTFCHFGNHPIIPSLKWTHLTIENPWLKYEDIYNIDSRLHYEEVFSRPIDAFVTIKGEKKFLSMPVCRECTSRPKCSKYNGKYPYQQSIDRINKEFNINIMLEKEQK